MVQNLTLNQISFFSPLLFKSYAFLIRTNRTISLLSINLVKNMPLFAVSLFTINGTNRGGIFQSVFFSGYAPKMLKIYTIPFFTNMVNNHSRRDIAICKIISNTMHSSGFFVKIKSAVTIFVQKTLPQMTIANNLKTIIKSYFIFFHIAHYTPLMANKQIKN